MKVTVSRKAHFNAAHRLYRKDWSDEKNNSVFGKCSNPHFHGHNYELIVHVTGNIDPETGYVMDMKKLKNLTYVTLAGATAVGVSSCGKYEDGPNFSLRSKKARVVNK